ncbi:hypothetical protein TNCV_2542281 [Trichonephila clavipes]|nr:hypothetical protein TNCV_2542281 [Trichonephila clavipes]
MSYDYVACKISLKCLFGLGALGKIKFLSRFRIVRAQVPSSGGENRRSKLFAPISIPPVWCRTKKRYQLPGHVLRQQSGCLKGGEPAQLPSLSLEKCEVRHPRVASEFDIHKYKSLDTVPFKPCGRDSLVVKVTDSWPACHEFEPGIADDPLRRGDRCTLNVSSSNVLPLVWSGCSETVVPAQVLSPSLNHGKWDLSCRDLYKSLASIWRHPGVSPVEDSELLLFLFDRASGMRSPLLRLHTAGLHARRQIVCVLLTIDRNMLPTFMLGNVIHSLDQIEMSFCILHRRIKAHIAERFRKSSDLEGRSQRMQPI